MIHVHLIRHITRARKREAEGGGEEREGLIFILRIYVRSWRGSVNELQCGSDKTRVKRRVTIMIMMMVMLVMMTRYTNYYRGENNDGTCVLLPEEKRGNDVAL